MNTEQSVENTLELAKLHYGDKLSVYRTSLVQHARNVARLAETIGRKLYQDVRADFASEETLENLAIMVHSALLHDVINVSRCAFEHVAEQTTVQIAAAVADLSRDFRLVETKRDMEFRGRLSQSPVCSQVVAVADIICTAVEVEEMISTLGLESASRARKILMQLDGDLLAITAAARFYTLRLYTHAARNKLTAASQLLKECKARAKLDRLVANATTGIRKKAAAKLSKSNSEESPARAKENKRGKKRTGRRSS